MQPIPRTGGGNFFTSPISVAPLPSGSSSRDHCRVTPNRPDCFADGLGEQMEAVERRRMAYVEQAREVSNGNASYNALLYPFGAVAVYEKLRGAPNHNLLLPAALAAGLYGFMNSGVPEREKFYLSAAAELQCAVIRQSAWLYRRIEIEPADLDRDLDLDLDGDALRQPQSLQDLAGNLKRSAAAFSTARFTALGQLKAPTSPAAPPGAIERRKGGGTGTRFKDMRADFLVRSGQQLKTALDTLDSLRQLRGQVSRAAWRLHQDSTDIEREVQARLSERVAQPKAPTNVAKDLLDGTNAIKLAAAQSAENGVALMNPAFLLGALKDMDKETLEQMTGLAKGAGGTLFDDWAAAQRFITAHAARLSQATDDQQSLGCQARLSALPALSVPVIPPPAKPLTAASTGQSVTQSLPN